MGSMDIFHGNNDRKQTYAQKGIAFDSNSRFRVIYIRCGGYIVFFSFSYSRLWRNQLRSILQVTIRATPPPTKPPHHSIINHQPAIFPPSLIPFLYFAHHLNSIHRNIRFFATNAHSTSSNFILALSQAYILRTR